MKTDNLTLRVLNSVFFEKATSKASRYTSGALPLLGLLKEVLNKATVIADSRNESVINLLITKITSLGRFVKAYASGEYREVSAQTILKIVAVLIYFVSPIDLIPDFIPVFGFSDDLAIVLWVFRTIASEIEAFETWEGQQLK
jgi:uncharacterized membrane protein YkvA (DUF1232 family)